MFGIAFVALMVFLGPIAVAAVDKAAPLPGEEPSPAEYFGPNRRMFEIAKALES